MFLFDVNVVLALFDPEHDMHSRARHWWTTKEHALWCTCEITRTGFVRLSCNPNATTNPKTAVAAWQILQSNCQAEKHRLLTLDADDGTSLNVTLSRCQGYRQVTDAFLIHLAIANGAVLATFDHRLKHLSPDPDAVEVIPLF